MKRLVGFVFYIVLAFSWSSCSFLNNEGKQNSSEFFNEPQGSMMNDIENKEIEKNKITMLIDGVEWKTLNLVQTIDFPRPEQPFYTIDISGGDYQGDFNDSTDAMFSIQFFFDEYTLKDPIGKYPIYAAAAEGAGAQVILMPLNPRIIHNIYQLTDPSKKNDILGYLTISKAKFERSGSDIWYSELEGRFEANLDGINEAGEAVNTSITQGTFNIEQQELPFAWSVGQDSGMKIRLEGRDWLSDHTDLSIDLLDDGNYSVMMYGMRSGMDMDVTNSGWAIRMFFNVPKDEIEKVSGEYLLGAVRGTNGEVYFEHDGKEDINVQGKLFIEGTDFKVVNGVVHWTYLSGHFELNPKGYKDPIKGLIHFSNLN